MPARVSAGGVRWRLRTGEDPEAVRPLLAAALAAVERGDARNVKTGRRKELYPLALRRPAPPDHLLKRNRYPLAVALRRVGRPSRSAHELALAEALAARGLPVPVPLAAGEMRSRGLLESCCLLLPVLDGATDVLDLVLRDALVPRARRTLAAALGRLARSAHDAGLFQDDFTPNNFLVRPEAPDAPLLIDFERARLRARVGRADRRWMLAKLQRGLPFAAATDRLRFLLAYTGGDRAEAHAWWRELETFTATLAERDYDRLARLATRDGRRYRRVRRTQEGFSGFARRELAEAELAAFSALPAPSPSGAGDAPTAEGAHAGALGPRAVRFYTGMDRGAARGLWVAANFLASRSLAPRPLALLARGREARLLLGAPSPAAPGPPAREAAAGLLRLRARLAAQGVPVRAVDPARVVWTREPSGRASAQVADPRGLQPRS